MKKTSIMIVLRALRHDPELNYTEYTIDSHELGSGHILIYPENVLKIYTDNAYKLATQLGWFSDKLDKVIDYQLTVEEVNVQETTASYYAHEYNAYIPAKITLYTYNDGTYDILARQQSKDKIILDGYDSTYDAASMYEEAFGVKRTTFPTPAEIAASSLNFDHASKSALIECTQWSNGCGDSASFPRLLSQRRFNQKYQIIVAKPGKPWDK